MDATPPVLINTYDGKGIDRATAGLAFNLNIAAVDIVNADQPNPHTTVYAFADDAATAAAGRRFDLAVEAERTNLARIKSVRENPLTDGV